MTEKRHEIIATGPSDPPKLPYRRPRITDYGSVALMTRTNQTGSIVDGGGKGGGGMMS
jgi:hypothetical protein